MTRALTNLTILDVMQDRAVFGKWFGGASWAAWRAALAAVFALPMTPDMLETYRTHTGRSAPPTGPAREAWFVVGRRGGKSRIAALAAVFLACFRSYADVLAPGEVGVVMLIAADKKQARLLLRYILGLLDAVPMLAALVTGRTQDSVTLSIGVVLEVHTRSFRTTRGYTIVAAICDELGFWTSDESANPDIEIIAGLRPAMLTIAGALLLGISTPYARRGVLWTAYAKHYAKDGDPVLVWQAPTLAMNGALDPHVVGSAIEADEVSAASEYLAQFRSDLEAFVSREALAACVEPGRYELPPVAGTGYVAFVDPSGGASDSMTLAVAHAKVQRWAVVDALLERKPPFSPEAVVVEFCEVLRRYGVAEVTGDRYGGEWPREQFRKDGVEYRLAEKPASDLFREWLPMVTSGRCELLDHRKLIAQALALERRAGRAGKDSIGHPPGGHDDLVVAVAGACVLAAVPVFLCEICRDPACAGWHVLRSVPPSPVAQAKADEDARETARIASRGFIAEQLRVHGVYFPVDEIRRVLFRIDDSEGGGWGGWGGR
jgi:hypothetical protein